MQKLKIGDRVCLRRQPTVVRQITEVRPSGYTWIYPEIPDQDFCSECSNDPFLDEAEWERFTLEDKAARVWWK